MKKTFHYSIVLTVFFALFSCKKEPVNDVEFEVVASATTYKVSDTVRFAITGNPDVITYYSGELGNNYVNRDRTSRTDGVLKLGFQIRVDNAAGFAALAANNFKVLVSNNFTSAYSTSVDPVAAATSDSLMANAASWKDVTSRFNIPTTGTVATFYTTTEAVLSDMATNPALPFYLAFKFDAPTAASLGTNGITISSLNLYNSYPDGSVVNFNLLPGSTVNAVWRIIKAANTNNSWTTSTTQLKFLSNATTAYSEDWAITTPLFPNLVLPDKSVTIKNINTNPVTSYAYKFSTPGVYNVVFVGSNNRVEGRKELVKEVTITIKP